MQAMIVLRNVLNEGLRSPSMNLPPLSDRALLSQATDVTDVVRKFLFATGSFGVPLTMINYSFRACAGFIQNTSQIWPSGSSKLRANIKP